MKGLQTVGQMGTDLNGKTREEWKHGKMESG